MSLSPQGAENMTHEDIIFYLGLIFMRDISSELLYAMGLVRGDQEVERGLKALLVMDTFPHW